MEQGVALRNDINEPLQNIGRIMTERYREHTAERRGLRGVGASRRSSCVLGCRVAGWRRCAHLSCVTRCSMQGGGADA